MNESVEVKWCNERNMTGLDDQQYWKIEEVNREETVSWLLHDLNQSMYVSETFQTSLGSDLEQPSSYTQAITCVNPPIDASV